MELCNCPHRPLPPPLLRRPPSPVAFFSDSSLAARSRRGTVAGVSFPFPMGKPGRILCCYSDETSTVERIEKSNDAVEVETAEEAASGIEGGAVDFLKDLDLKLLSSVYDLKRLSDLSSMNLDTEETFNILLLGSGALVALLVTSGIVSAIDSLPVFPKAMEVVGLGFTVWFSARYLIFKSNRDELLAQIESLKEQIIGPSDS